MAATRPGKAIRNKAVMKKSRFERKCDICHGKIIKGQFYAMTVHGTVYCKDCE